MPGFIKCPKCDKLTKQTTLCPYCGYDEVADKKTKHDSAVHSARAPYLGQLSVFAPILMIVLTNFTLRLMEQEQQNVARQMAIAGLVLAFVFIGLGLIFAITGLQSAIKSKNAGGMTWSGVGLVVNTTLAVLWLRPSH